MNESGPADNHENQGPSGENINDILLAIHDTDPTGEEFWYTEDPNTGNRIPLNTKKDETGTVRELLDDGTLGREVRQDPSNDPERVRNLYGTFESPSDDHGTAAVQTLPQTQKIDARPTILSSESTGDNDPLGTNQGRANALAAQTGTINAEIAESSPDNDPTSDDPAKFEENTASYYEKLKENLDTITAALMQKADALNGLGMPDAARLFATKAEQTHAIIADQIDAVATDYSALASIYDRYFNGDPTSILPQIKPALSVDSSTTKFGELLARTTSIPELTYIADQLVESRHDLKAKKLEQLRSATTTDEQQQIEGELQQSESRPDDSTEFNLPIAA